MVPRRAHGRSDFEWIRERYENTEKRCSECGYVDEEGNWTSHTDGQRIVYRHVCPSCEASHEHVFDLGN
ncbi:HVO_0649 family zinc finger protein [Haloterrigena salifodinae]|uniref:HVO_0649 family zinc finger protein n=1 Tax=Haloterrigena salifodinae TaxID=2675099 RepID=UPI000F867136